MTVVKSPDRISAVPNQPKTRAYSFRLPPAYIEAIDAEAWEEVLGTIGGYQARRALVAKNGGHDLPIALLEDAVAVLGAFAIVAAAAAL